MHQRSQFRFRPWKVRQYMVVERQQTSFSSIVMHWRDAVDIHAGRHRVQDVGSRHPAEFLRL